MTSMLLKLYMNGTISNMLSLFVDSKTLFNKTSIHEGTPAKLVTFSFMVSSTIACLLCSHSLINDTLLLGVLLNSAQNGILSISMALKSPKTVPFSLYFLVIKIRIVYTFYFTLAFL